MELKDLMRLLDQGYAPAGNIAVYGWDFEAGAPRPAGSGDELARFICSEVADSFDSKVSSLEQMKQMHAELTRASEDLTHTAAAIHAATVKFIAVSFWSWFRKTGRRFYTSALLSSWCDVHDDQLARDLYVCVRDYIAQVINSRTLTDEVLADIDRELCGELLVKPTEPPTATT